MSNEMFYFFVSQMWLTAAINSTENRRTLIAIINGAGFLLLSYLWR